MTKYDDSYWRDLPPNAQRAASLLGYNQELWDNGGDQVPKVWRKQYDQLSDEEKDAAKSLGYMEKEWKKLQCHYPKYNDYNWNELPSVAKRAATVFGFNQTKWDEDQISENWKKSYIELSEEHKDAAFLLGYHDEEMWNLHAEKK
ncbi:hypothetical protein CTEN210_07937 [Chaetoceros tenuissimus]|uniref:Uncharacterized protein n=1 Tax=Chaetoceros tenuissimus TaxID=426638 RepID=A0AAD3CSM9_9STRA|nr:hypothetical protein CTEN210_07937 [Chaetoceros tenuissimus]